MTGFNQFLKEEPSIKKKENEKSSNLFRSCSCI